MVRFSELRSLFVSTANYKIFAVTLGTVFGKSTIAGFLGFVAPSPLASFHGRERSLLAGAALATDQSEAIESQLARSINIFNLDRGAAIRCCIFDFLNLITQNFCW